MLVFNSQWYRLNCAGIWFLNCIKTLIISKGALAIALTEVEGLVSLFSSACRCVPRLQSCASDVIL